MFCKLYIFPVFQATGGSGNYTWTSSVPDVATVTTRGQVVTATVTGETVVKAADTKNLNHYDSMQVIVNISCIEFSNIIF